MNFFSSSSKILLVITSCCFFFGCQVEQEINPLDSKPSTISYKKQVQKNSSYELYSNLLLEVVLEATKSKEFRLFIKQQAKQQFDGDYDILLASSLEKEVSKGQSLETFLLSVAQKNLKSKEINKEGKYFFRNLIKECPLIQISIPEVFEQSTEKWDIDSENILVTRLPFDYDELTYNSIIGYDIKGNKHELSLDKAPQVPVIVISINERVEAISSQEAKNRKDLAYFSNEYYNYYLQYSKESEIENDNILNRISDDVHRDLNDNTDILYKGRFVSKAAFRQVEAWPSGRPEFKVIIVYNDKDVSTGSALTASSLEKILSKDGWISRYGLWVNLSTKIINVPIFRWYRDRFGLYMKYRWIEQDGGEPTEITTTLNNKFDDNTTLATSVKTTIKDRDDEAGESIVQYEDDTEGEGTEYNTGIIKFRVKQ